MHGQAPDRLSPGIRWPVIRRWMNEKEMQDNEEERLRGRAKGHMAFINLGSIGFLYTSSQRLLLPAISSIRFILHISFARKTLETGANHKGQRYRDRLLQRLNEPISSSPFLRTDFCFRKHDGRFSLTLSLTYFLSSNFAVCQL